ncbi:MAG: PEP-CTERM sorting domain-containing protein [Alphaproteobacteria bacterium]
MTLGVISAAALLWAAPAGAVPYHYVDWTSADVAGGTASGTITLPDSSTVTVDFEAINADDMPGNLFFAQTAGGTNYWAANGGAPYISSEVDNAPPDSDIVALIGGVNQTYRVTLSEPIKDPIMAVLSLGQGGVPTTYDFDSPFDIVSQGSGHWGGTSTSLTELPGDILQGVEGHGTIQFIGTFTTFEWVVPTPETWHGFTFGIRTTEAIEPTPIPEPAGLAVLGLGLAGLGWIRRRRNY